MRIARKPLPIAQAKPSQYPDQGWELTANRCDEAYEITLNGDYNNEQTNMIGIYSGTDSDTRELHVLFDNPGGIFPLFETFQSDADDFHLYIKSKKSNDNIFIRGYENATGLELAYIEIKGGNGNDYIEFTYPSLNPANDGSTSSCEFNKATIYGGGGNDTIIVDGPNYTSPWLLTETAQTDPNVTVTSAFYQMDLSACGFGIEGKLGNDTISISQGLSYIQGGDGNDTITGGTGSNYIIGGAGKDVINGNLAHDILIGDEGNDEIYGGLGNDAISGGTGNDILKGGDGRDHIEGREGNDNIYGNNGYDTIYGHEGSDTIYPGNDGGDFFNAGEDDDGSDWDICNYNFYFSAEQTKSGCEEENHHNAP